MTTAIKFPLVPLVTGYALRAFALQFLRDNADIGVRNCDIGRAIGYNDSRQWFSYGVAESLIKQGLAEKRKVDGVTRYFPCD